MRQVIEKKTDERMEEKAGSVETVGDAGLKEIE